ncbi:hypothetical protein D3C80_2129500 [compost metagenome]
MLGLFEHTFRDEIKHRTFNIARRILLQTRHNQILLIHNAPVIERHFTVEDFHQRRFTGAVTANQTDALIRLDV